MFQSNQIKSDLFYVYARDLIAVKFATIFTVATLLHWQLCIAHIKTSFMCGLTLYISQYSTI